MNRIVKKIVCKIIGHNVIKKKSDFTTTLYCHRCTKKLERVYSAEFYHILYHSHHILRV